jgi:maltose O-acetyltransferase
MWPYRIRKGLYALAELFLHWVVDPRLRAFLISMLGAKVGRNVRVYEATFINLEKGFSNLVLHDDVHIGHSCLLDLHDLVILEKGVTLSPRVSILTHSDPGKSHQSPICNYFPPKSAGVIIREYSWIGASSTILAGVVIGRETVVGAAGLVCHSLEGGGVYLGVPAKLARRLAD